MTNETQEIDADALRARLAAAPTADEVDRLDALLARQHAILTGVANALRGDPGPLASHSHHDLAERAAAVVAMLAVTQASLEAASSGRRVTVVDEIERLQREIATLRAAYASDLDGLRAELRRADDERAAWRDRVEARDEVAERLTAELSAATGEVERLRAALAEATSAEREKCAQECEAAAGAYGALSQMQHTLGRVDEFGIDVAAASADARCHWLDAAALLRASAVRHG